jgi:hypothetical protein
MSQLGLRRRARSPEVAQEIVARMLEAHDYRVMPLGLSGYLIPAAALPDLLRFMPDQLVWRPDRPARLVDVKSAVDGEAKIKLRALDTYQEWQRLTGLEVHVFLWSYATGRLSACRVDDLRANLAAYPVGQFHDSGDEFALVPLPGEAVDLTTW